MRAQLALCCAALALTACNQPAPALTSADVQQFVRDYASATNTADASKIMSMVLHDATASSISLGRVDQGWDAMRVSTDTAIGQRRGEVVLGAMEVVAVSGDVGVAVGTLNVRGVRHIGNLVVDNLPGAFTIVVKRTPEGLRLVHEHYSVRAK
jgi:ketosteroid isomerase-like protein